MACEMSDNYQYLIIGLLIYVAIAGVFLLVLGFNQREGRSLRSHKQLLQQNSEKDPPRP
jgi:hypothetical protein